jgi:small-conductance mechanosensitive channel
MGDGKLVILPNGSVTSAAITNYSTEGTLRLDMTFGEH